MEEKRAERIRWFSLHIICTWERERGVRTTGRRRREGRERELARLGWGLGWDGNGSRERALYLRDVGESFSFVLGCDRGHPEKKGGGGSWVVGGRKGKQGDGGGTKRVPTEERD